MRFVVQDEAEKSEKEKEGKKLFFQNLFFSKPRKTHFPA
jgi:hypothetical protein